MNNRLSQLLTLIKTDWRFKAITASAAVILFSLIGTLVLYRTRTQLGFEQRPVVFPSAAPKITSQWATHPTVVSATATVASASSQLRDLVITNHPLLPPSLDTRVTLEQ